MPARNNLELPLSEIIGIPIGDLAHAESHAAQASVEFIESVGFIRSSSDEPNEIGAVRFVTFDYVAEIAPAKSIQRKVNVPLLSLVPIPFLQVESGEFEFTVRLLRKVQLHAQTCFQEIGSSPQKTKSLSSMRWDYIAQVDSPVASDEDKKYSYPNIKIKINVKQSDLPAGIGYLLRKLDQLINEIEK
jgi:hypothetical protein